MHRRPTKLAMTTIFKRFRMRFAQDIRTAILETGGLVLITIAAFHVTQVDLLAGFAVAGLSCFAFNWMVGE